MAGLLDRYKKLPGKSLIVKAEYFFWRRLMRALVSHGILYRNGELAIKPQAEPSRQNLRDPIRNPKVICLTGFGHSGSGAVADLLSEYEGVTVQGFVDKNGSLRQDAGMEFDILRHSGGFFDLENAVMTTNPFLQDAAIKCFMSLVAYYYYDSRCYYREHLLSESRRFLEKIVACVCPTPSGFEYNPHLKMLGDKGFDLFYGRSNSQQAIFTIRKMSRDEYRTIVRQFMSGMLPNMANTEYLMLDQIVSDCTADIDRYEEYLGPIKLIAVYRDPRDVFVTGINLNEDWIPHEVETFVRWYRRQLEPYLRLSHNDFRLFRFEDLVLKYDEMVVDIEKFLGIDPKSHTRRHAAFNPEVSQKNIGLHRKFSNEKSVAAITESLREYCFNG